MNSLPSFLLPAVLGLVAGVSHGVFSHQANLPVSLGEQLLSAVSPVLQTESDYGWDEQ